MSKNSHPSTKKKSPAIKIRDSDANVSPWIEDYLDFYDGQLKPITKRALEQIGKDLLAYAHDEKTKYLRIEWFFSSKRIPSHTAYTWAQKYPEFGEAYQAAKHILGMRREALALNKQYDAGMVSKSIHMFDPMYAQIKSEEKQDKIDIAIAVKQAQEQNSHVTVLMQPFEDKIPLFEDKKYD